MYYLMKDVAAFRAACGLPMAAAPGWIEDERLELNGDMLAEEYKETCDALAARDLVKFTDGLGDLIYVAISWALEMGLPMAAVWRAIQDANMRKVDPATGWVRKRGDGKVLKPDGWQPPDIAGVLETYRRAADR